jgi:DNA-binding GntR family transcriptional regulator
MSRQNYLFQETVNAILKIIEPLDKGQSLSTDSSLAKQLDVSRSTVKKALDHIESLNVISRINTHKIVTNKPSTQHYFDRKQLAPAKDKQIEAYFMDLIGRGQIKPGDRFSELELSRQSNCNTITVREFLIRFSRFGLIEKKPRSQWQMKNFDELFVDQLYEVRYVFEMHSLSRFMTLNKDSKYWAQLEELLEDHIILKNEIDGRYQDFSLLDQRFHTLLQEAHPNQFITEFYEIISFVFHYHYQWDKRDEKQRNNDAIDQHIEIISKMLMNDYQGATICLEKHLNTAKQSLKKTVFQLPPFI